MGCSCSEMAYTMNRRNTVIIERDALSLLITGRTSECLAMLHKKPHISFSAPINNRGDNYLHYACKLNNYEVCQYMLYKDPQSASIKNIYGKLPSELATDVRVTSLFPAA